MARRTKAVEKNESTPEAGEKHKPQNSSSGFKAPRWLVVGGIISAIVMCLAVYLLRYDRVIGLMADDAWYILLAQAIASGHGFTLINSPSPGIIPFYPPGLPFLLSLVFRVAPRFPENVWLLKCITVVAVFGLGVACYRYFSFYRGLSRALSLAIALAVVIHPI
ncbi:MAG TPA: hypothetical protein VEF04_10455, partial [Blastocatellia bacterium]|nr:hypothetical protein [Blastocatellia bacterium]